MNKKQQQMLRNVTLSNNETLYNVYETFSEAKYIAFDNCKNEMRYKNGFNFRITSATPYSFSCGFLYYDEEKRLHCRYYTNQNTYDFIAE